jgi:AAA+ ATPase superfamily predicted ATPase
MLNGAKYLSTQEEREAFRKLQGLLKRAIENRLEIQNMRVAIISRLIELFEAAMSQVKESGDPAEWIRIANSIARTLDSIAKSYDSARFDEEVQKLERLLEEARRKVERQTEGAREGDREAGERGEGPSH